MQISYLLAIIIFVISGNLSSMHTRPEILNVIFFHPDNPDIDIALEPFKSKINVMYNNYSYPLIAAVHSGKKHATTYLLQNGANPNARQNDIHQYTALHYLAECKDNLLYIKKYTNLAELLIAYGANPYLGAYGRRAIDKATRARNSKMVTIFESVYRWQSNSDLRKTWVTAAVMFARKPEMPAINTCTAIVPYTGPKA